ncbi:chorismate mutase [Gemmobacter serpentinus]|uniref:chorismate mutase n=1 Tax=Gemmobacter serpentinus TaxID=2652247 RepID=UPI00124DBA21|nr:chorismate mutase [Gemmobacter serpentinus]
MKAPQDCRNMAELRVQIDALDRELVTMLARRVTYIDRAVELKPAEGLPARIDERVEAVVAKVRATAGEIGFDADLAETIWRRMIEWSIAREEEILGPKA